MALDYKRWDKFCKVIGNAKIACEKSDYDVLDHFYQLGKMVEIGSGAKRKQVDYELSRYACYLIVQNSDTKKQVVALGQTYFAMQTRKQELTEKEYSKLTEDEKRLYRRKQTKDGNKILYKIAREKGVKKNENLY